MLSLYQALPKAPADIVHTIESFLDVRSLASWRLVNKRSFLDVEAKVRKLVFDIEKKQLLGGSFLQEPTGLWLGSAWFQFMINVFSCKQCHKYQLSNQFVQAEQDRLCSDCFNQMLQLVPCDNCGVFHKESTCFRCHECLFVSCDDCSDNIMDMCLECTELFCHSCCLDDCCLHCQ